MSGNRLIIFTSDENERVRYVLSRHDFMWLFMGYLVLLLLGIILLLAYFSDWGSSARLGLSDALNLAWLSSPSLCGCASYYIRLLYRLCYRLKKELAPSDSAQYECELVNRRGTLWYFVSRAFAVPIGAYISLLLLQCGIIGLFKVSVDAIDEYAIAGISYLLGIAGGRLLSYLLDLGASTLPKSEA